jgi:hypothetical protein
MSQTRYPRLMHPLAISESGLGTAVLISAMAAINQDSDPVTQTTFSRTSW